MRVVYDVKTYLAQAFAQKLGRTVDPSEIQLVSSVQPNDGVLYHGKIGDSDLLVPVNRVDVSVAFSNATKQTLTAIDSDLLKTFEAQMGLDLAASDWVTENRGNSIVLKPSAKNKVWTSELSIPINLTFPINSLPYSAVATVVGMASSSTSVTPKGGKLSTGLVVTMPVVTHNYISTSKPELYKASKDLYIVGADVKRSEIEALGLNVADAITSNKSFKIVYTGKHFKSTSIGFFDVNLDTGAWNHFQQFGTVYGDSLAHIVNQTITNIAPPAARHIRIPTYSSNAGCYDLNISLISL